MLWLLAILLVPIALLIAVIALPVRLRLRGQADQNTRLRLDVYAFGGVAPAIPVVDTARKSKSSKKKPRKKKTKSSAHSGKPGSGFADRNVLKLIKELMGRFEIVWIRGEAEFGLDDPADTGAVYGVLAPLLYTGKHAAGIDIDVRPDFAQRHLSGKIDAAVELVPITLVPPVIRFGWSRWRTD